MNSMVLLGRLGANAELRYTPQGTALFEVSVAHNKRNGETYVTTWFKVTVWGKQAETWAILAKKGCEVFAMGDFERREYTDRDGVKKGIDYLNAHIFRVCATPHIQPGVEEEGPTL